MPGNAKGTVPAHHSQVSHEKFSPQWWHGKKRACWQPEKSSARNKINMINLKA
jgi:hypothetical protein